MADLVKIISELVSAMRKKGGAEPVKELILKAEPTGSSVLRGSEKFDIPHVFQDIGEFERARGMLGAAFPDQIISPSHRLGDAASPMFPQGAGANSIKKLIKTELPDFSPDEIDTVASDLGAYMRKTGNSDVESALMNMLDDPAYNPGGVE